MLERIHVTVNEFDTVSAIVTTPTDATCCVVFAHGAGAGMEHPYMDAIAQGLQALRIATLRYQFPYMQKHSGRPDRPPLCHDTVRAAVIKANEMMAGMPLIAGGKSFGGRMTSQAQAIRPLPNVRGLCFFGFPLHAPRTLSTTRAEHLASITIPMLFLQGTRDLLADWNLMHAVSAKLHLATLERIEYADHGFHVPVRSGSSDAQVMQYMLQRLADWSRGAIGSKPT